MKIFDRVRKHLSTLEKEFKADLAKKSGSKDVKALSNKVEKADEELLNLPNFLVTPHIGGSSKEAILAMGRAAIQGLEV